MASSSITITVFGGTAGLATDFNTSGAGFSGIHIPINKLSWGDENISYRVSDTYPLPVKFYGSSGDSISVTGKVEASGSFPIINQGVGTTNDPIYALVVAGNTSGGGHVGVSGPIEGRSGGFPVGVTGDITIANTSVAIGYSAGATPVEITGGRYLSSLTDKVTVSGTVGISGGRALNTSQDSVKVFGAGGGNTVGIEIHGAGFSGDALKVAMVNAGITFTVGLNTQLGVTNDAAEGLFVRGITGAYPITVKGENDGAISITTTDTLPVSTSGAWSINDDRIIQALQGATAPGVSKLDSIQTNTSAITTISSNITNGRLFAKISEVTRPGSIISGSKIISTSGSQFAKKALKSGVTIKAAPDNTNIVYVGDKSVSNAVNNGYPLEAGESLFLECNNLSLLFARTVSGTGTIHYIGS